jgi:DNA polymerase III delta prime subunit
MAASLRASEQGLEIVDHARRKKGWTKTEEAWWGLAFSSQATLKRFLQGKPIKRDAFISLCQAVGIENWEEIAEDSSIQPTNSLISWFSYDDNWVGREEAIAHLSKKLRGSCRVLILTGMTGIGKTALAECLAVELQGNWTECCRVNFDDKERVTDFASVAAELLAGWHETVMPEEGANPQQLLYRLVKRLREHRYLLLIDALERILKGNEETGWSGFEDEWWERFFEQLMTAESCQSRVILTSQVKSRQLEEIGYRYPNFCCMENLRGLTELEQLALFEKIGLEVGETSPHRQYLERIGAAYEGHPLALRVIAGEIANSPFKGNVVAYWKKYGHEIEAVEQARQQETVDSAEERFRLAGYNPTLQTAVKRRVERTLERLANEVFNAYLLLCHGSVYRHPVPETAWLRGLRRLGYDEQQQQAALDAIRDRYLLEELIDDNNDWLLRQHNLIRSVALENLKNLTTREQPA